MSDWELRYFYLLEWSDAVIDIQEQYPLLSLSVLSNVIRSGLSRMQTSAFGRDERVWRLLARSIPLSLPNTAKILTIPSGVRDFLGC